MYFNNFITAAIIAVPLFSNTILCDSNLQSSKIADLSRRAVSDHYTLGYQHYKRQVNSLADPEGKHLTRRSGSDSDSSDDEDHEFAKLMTKGKLDEYFAWIKDPSNKLSTHLIALTISRTDLESHRENRDLYDRWVNAYLRAGKS
jgi:hypothetical protein